MGNEKAFTLWGTILALVVLLMIVALLNPPSAETAITGGAVSIDFGYRHYGIAWAVIVLVFVLAVYMEFLEGKKGEKIKEVAKEGVGNVVKEIKKQL